MSSSAKYLIAQYTPDLLRQEPRNVGVLVVKGSERAARFLGEVAPGDVDGRKVRSLKAPDVYMEWVDYWRGELEREGELEDLLNHAPEYYRLVRGGQIMESGEDSEAEILEFLYTRLVGGGFSEAINDALETEAEAASTDAPLPAEIESALLNRHILQLDQPDVFVQVPYPVQRRRRLNGRSRATYRPDFVQENGSLYVMEAIDLTGYYPSRIRDHAGAVAYMYSDLRAGDEERLQPISIVRVTDEARKREDIQDSIWMLESESRIVNWLDQGDRDQFLRERIEAAGGAVEGE